MQKFKDIFGNRSHELNQDLRKSENVTIGVQYRRLSKYPIIGINPIIRSNSVIYNDVEIGDNFKTGHNVLIRENRGRR